MARNDICGLFWDDTPPPKIIKEKIKRIPPTPVWLQDDYLPGLQEALAFNVDLFTVEDLRLAWLDKERLVFDIECYENYFLIAFASVKTGKVCYWDLYDQHPMALESLKWLITNFTIVSFNGNNYDEPILAIAASGRNTSIMKRATNDIIMYGMRPHDIYKTYKVKKLKLDHIDLIEVCPLSANLKLYAGRLHCKKMQDLPFAPESILSPEQIAITRHYCINDLVNTALLHQSLEDEIDLRIELGSKYGMDLRSKSDAQIAEAVIAGELRKRGRGRIIKPEVQAKTSFHYNPPSYLKFQTSDILEQLAANPFVITEAGKVAPNYNAHFIDWGDKQLRLDQNGEWAKKPKGWEFSLITLGGVQFKMGMGGLHSIEKNVGIKSNEKYTLRDVDVESFYPRIILNLKLFPVQLGIDFLMVFNGIVDRRLAAKEYKRMKESNSLKIVINGSFGKFGSIFSILYSPNLIIQTTLTGQLSLMMLIEWLGLAGIQVVSANTDGVVSYVGKHQEEQFQHIVKYWEQETRFKMEETVYSALYSRDVNNYIAIKTDGKVKHKGAYSNHWNDNSTFRFHKNPTNLICIDAVTEYLTKAIPIEHTIRTCQDITKFVTVRDVKGGGVKVWSGMGALGEDKIEYLGKAIRWFYAEGVEGEIIYAKSGNKVPRSEGAMPCMELPDVFPTNINYQWYIDEAYKILTEIGAC